MARVSSYLFGWSLVTGGVTAAELTLVWNANPEPNVAGYVLHYGQASHEYTSTIDAGIQTSVKVPSLSEGRTYYFAVSAYSIDRVESPPSDEISYTVPMPPPPPTDALITQSVEPEEIVLGEDMLPGDGTGLSVSESAFLPGSGYQFKLQAMLASRITIYGSHDLESWSVLGSVANPTGVLLIRDPEATGMAQRFYRFEPTQVVSP